MNAQDYHFYDANDDNMETQGLLGINAQFVNEEPKTAQLGFIGGALTTLVVLAISIMSWILYHKNRGKILLAHAIITTVGFVLAALATVWALGAKNGLRTNISPNPLLTLITFAGSLIMSAYFLAAALFLWVYRDFYLNYMHVAKLNPKEWAKYFWNHDFAKSKVQDWRIILAIVILCLVAALLFAMLSYAGYCFLKNKIQTSRITLMIGLVAVTVFAFLAIIWDLDNKEHNNLIKGYFRNITGNLYLWVIVIGIVTLFLAFVNALLTLLRFRASNFVFGVIWIGFAFLLLVFFGLLFRDIGKFPKNKPMDCRDTADLVHEKDYKEFCPNKYLAADKTCRKEDFAIRWENPSRDLATLNPACCQVSNDLIIWPVYILAIWGLFLLISMFIAAIANFALTNQDPAYDEAFKSTNMIDIMTIVIILLLGIAFGLYLILRPVHLPKNSSFSGRPGFNVKPDGSIVPKPAFAKVKDNEQELPKVPEKCFRFDSSTIPSKIVDPSTCTEKSCGISLGLLVTNGYFNTDSMPNSVQQGPKTYRQYFFPKANNSQDSFLHLYGSEDSVHEALKSIFVCHWSPLVGAGLYVNVFQVDLSSLKSNALTRGVNPGYVAPVEGGSRPNFDNYTQIPAPCKVSCTLILIDNSLSLLNLVGQLIIKDKQGNYTSYGVPEADIEVKFIVTEEGSKKIVGHGVYDANGVLKIPVPALRNTNYVGTVEIRDRSGHYLPDDIDVAVTYGGPDKDIDIGKIILTTISGKGCKDNADIASTDSCFRSLKPASYNLKLKVLDPETNQPPIKNPTYKVIKTHAITGQEVSAGSFNNGNASISLPAGYYTVLINGETYSQSAARFTLDEDKDEPILLTKADSKAFRIVMDIDNTKSTDDYDLNLKISTPDGQECIVSPFNRVCPYARYIHDVKNSEKGKEVIEVDNFVKAFYLVFVSKSPSYQGECPESKILSKRLLSQTSSAHKIFGVTNTNEMFDVRTTGGNVELGENAASNSILNRGISNFVSRDTEEFHPIKYGGETVPANILEALSERIEQGEKKPQINELLNKVVKNPGQIDDFMYSLPKLYTPEEIQQQLQNKSNGTALSKELSTEIIQDLSILKDKNFEIGNKELEYGKSDSLKNEYEKLTEDRNQTGGLPADETIPFEKEKEVLNIPYKDAPVDILNKEEIKPVINVKPQAKESPAGECLECVELEDEPDRIIDDDFVYKEYPGVEEDPLNDDYKQKINQEDSRDDASTKLVPMKDLFKPNKTNGDCIGCETDPLLEPIPTKPKVETPKPKPIQKPVEKPVEKPIEKPVEKAVTPSKQEPLTEVIPQLPEASVSDVNSKIAATPVASEQIKPNPEEKLHVQPSLTDIHEDVAILPVEKLIVKEEQLPRQQEEEPTPEQQSEEAPQKSSSGFSLDANMRRLADQKANFYTQFCFTGFGQKSIKQLDRSMDQEPSIDVCKSLYPKSSPYALEKLD